MTAAELLAKCRHLTLAGKNEEGELEWIGTYGQWIDAENEETKIFHVDEFKKIWK